MKEIDGSLGEGGGQVLRTSLSLAATLGEPVRIVNVRSSRPKPGLRRQHLAGVRAVAAICDAEVSGDAIDSQEVVFRPREVRPGDHAFSVGTAGSACLVLQTVLPPLLLAAGPSRLRIEGGTHNPWAPPYDFLARSFLPLVERMGPRVQAELVRPGFAPVGGGLIEVLVEPAPSLAPLRLPERGKVLRTVATAVVAGLPVHVAERELDVARRRLDLDPLDLRPVVEAPSRGPANVFLLEFACEHVTEVFVGFGRRGLPAERVAAGTVREAERWLAAGVPVGEHLADQLLLPMALAGEGSFRTLPLSSHATTNRDVIRAFLDVAIDVREGPDGATEVTVRR
jgi:RNA 3'-terminal phosphate cyclase (ATP)